MSQRLRVSFLTSAWDVLDVLRRRRPGIAENLDAVADATDEKLLADLEEKEAKAQKQLLEKGARVTRLVAEGKERPRHQHSKRVRKAIGAMNGMLKRMEREPRSVWLLALFDSVGVNVVPKSKVGRGKAFERMLERLENPEPERGAWNQGELNEAFRCGCHGDRDVQGVVCLGDDERAKLGMNSDHCYSTWTNPGGLRHCRDFGCVHRSVRKGSRNDWC